MLSSISVLVLVLIIALVLLSHSQTQDLIFEEHKISSLEEVQEKA